MKDLIVFITGIVVGVIIAVGASEDIFDQDSKTVKGPD
jgi:hypothetical protein